MFFEGDQHPLNPARYLPTWFHTKYAQARTPLSQYIQQESVGTRMRRWERPWHDFLGPWFRGMAQRLTGENIVPEDVERRRDLDTLVDRTKTPGASPIYVPLPDLQYAPAHSSARSANSRVFRPMRVIPRSRFPRRLQSRVARRFRAP
jgi:hypothetical protein